MLVLFAVFAMESKPTAVIPFAVFALVVKVTLLEGTDSFAILASVVSIVSIMVLSIIYESKDVSKVVNMWGKGIEEGD